MDRVALPKDVTFDHQAGIPFVSIGSDSRHDRAARDGGAAMHNDADDPAGDDSDDDGAVPGGAVTPVWPAR